MNLLNYKAQKPFKHKHLLTLLDYSKDDILQILSLAVKIKADNAKYRKLLSNKTLAMIFAKSSTRTRISFEVGATQLGAHPLILSSDQMQLGRGETIEDTAKVLSGMVDGIMIRTFNQSDLESLANSGTIPIINGLTDLYHPCQILADFLTIYEHLGTLEGLKLCYMGDGNNMTHSLMIGCAILGIDFSCGCPKDAMPLESIVKKAKEIAKESNANIVITSDPKEAAKDANIIYTDVWCSMGQEEKDIEKFMPYQVNSKLFSYANEACLFMHCLPAHREQEVTANIMDGAKSIVFDEAHNRLHAQKAVLALLMGEQDEL